MPKSDLTVRISRNIFLLYLHILFKITVADDTCTLQFNTRIYQDSPVMAEVSGSNLTIIQGRPRDNFKCSTNLSQYPGQRSQCVDLGGNDFRCHCCIGTCEHPFWINDLISYTVTACDDHGDEGQFLYTLTTQHYVGVKASINGGLDGRIVEMPGQEINLEPEDKKGSFVVTANVWIRTCMAQPDENGVLCDYSVTKSQTSARRQAIHRVMRNMEAETLVKVSPRNKMKPIFY